METITSALFYMQNRLHIILTLFCSALLYALTGCRETSPYGKLLMDGCYPYALWHQGKYYCMIQERSTTDIISLTVVDNLSDWPSAKQYTIFKAKEKGLNRIYSPEIHIIKGKWFVYFEADDGKDTDTHQLYVLEAQELIPPLVLTRFMVLSLQIARGTSGFIHQPSLFMVLNICCGRDGLIVA